MKISEKSFEEAIETALLASGPDAASDSEVVERGSAYGQGSPGGYRKRSPDEYDRELCLIPQDVVDFVMATQPKEWAKLKQHHGEAVKERFLKRLSSEIVSRGTLSVIRQGVKDLGCKFNLACFRPSSGLNPELQKLYEANVFTAVRQVKYSLKNENSIDLVIFLNGLPLFTAELKNPFNGQRVGNAIYQYRTDRDPKEPLLTFRRCLGHFAVDPDDVFVATRLQGKVTRFLPFNQGNGGGKGNPPVPPTVAGYATDYLWKRIFARDSVLNLIQHFIHEQEKLDDDGNPTGEKALLFPRYHQLESVRGLVSDAREKGTGQHYLIEHSAGSGKSNSIAWLAHQLSVLHDSDDRRVFDSIVVITDRKVLDRQLQRTIRQFEQTEGVVENIDKTSRQLKEALEDGKTIIVTTLQKFPVIADQMGALAGKRFAVIIDEAHSSQSGETTRSLNQVLASGSLEDAEKEEGDEEPEDLEDRIVAQMTARKQLPNVSYFAFTATPKPKTLELFGRKRPDGRFEPFSLYSMRQAIEEEFILDVLENYTTYKTYWRLLKTVADDPRYDRDKANVLLQSFVGLHPHAVRKKVEIMAEHFHEKTASRIGGRAKAMIVTRSRLHAVTFKRELDKYLAEKAYPYRALVAFSGTIQGATEAQMNGFPESRTAKRFSTSEYRFLVVAEKFQTGFDEPLLHTMYVDKKLGGVNAVQTLSRLNRTAPGKDGTAVLDFANEPEEIQKAFQPYYEKTMLSEATDPNKLYDIENELLAFGVFNPKDVDAFGALYFDPKATQDVLYSSLVPVVARAMEMKDSDRKNLRGKLVDFVRLYSFLAQILPFTDPNLEKLYVFSRLLFRYIPKDPRILPQEIKDQIDMESYRVHLTSAGSIGLDRGAGVVKPATSEKGTTAKSGEEDLLSRILSDLNERFGTDFTPEDRIVIASLEEELRANESLATSVRVNTKENARLAFDHVVTDRLQGLVDKNFKFYKKVTDDKEFAKAFLDILFARFVKQARENPG